MVLHFIDRNLDRGHLYGFRIRLSVILIHIFDPIERTLFILVLLESDLSTVQPWWDPVSTSGTSVEDVKLSLLWCSSVWTRLHCLSDLNGLIFCTALVWWWPIQCLILFYFRRAKQIREPVKSIGKVFHWAVIRCLSSSFARIFYFRLLVLSFRTMLISVHNASKLVNHKLEEFPTWCLEVFLHFV